MPKLTKRTVEAIRAPATGDVLVWDSQMPRFGVRVYPSGRRVYVVQYRASGRTRRVLVGRHGVITADEARTKARKMLRAVDDGADPAADRRAARGAPTVADLAERYMREHADPHKKPRSVREDRRIIGKHVLPALGGLQTGAVGHEDIERLHLALRATPVMANRVLALLGKMFALAEQWGVRPRGSNPVQYVRAYRERKRDRFLTGAELGRLGQALREVEADGSEQRQVVAAVRLLLLTGARKGEVLGLRWADVDLDGAVLYLRDAKHGPRPVVLSAPAVDVLRGLERAGEYVIPGRRPDRPRATIDKAWQRIRARANLPDVRLHDMRHLFGGTAATAGHGLQLVGRLLGHAEARSTQRYAHLADAAVRQAAEETGRRIGAALES